MAACVLLAASRGLATPPSDRVLQEEAGPSGVHAPEQSLERGGAKEIVDAGYARGNAKLSKEHNPLNKWKRDRSGQFHNQMWFLKQEGIDHFEEWGEDHDKPWPYKASDKANRPIPENAVPSVGAPEPGEMVDRSWMVLSGKIQDGLPNGNGGFKAYSAHYCPAVIAPPIFTAAGGGLCRTCLTVVNEILEYINIEQNGAVVPEPMRTDTEQMQTAFVKVCSQVADVDPAAVQDCKNMVEYWGAEIWCHIASGSYVDENSKKPYGMDRSARVICSHLKMVATDRYMSAAIFNPVTSTGYCNRDGNTHPLDVEWFEWLTQANQMALCCPSMYTGVQPVSGKTMGAGLDKADAVQNSVPATLARDYHNEELIDLRYEYTKPPVLAAADADGVLPAIDDAVKAHSDPRALPLPAGFRDRIYNVGNEW